MRAILLAGMLLGTSAAAGAGTTPPVTPMTPDVVAKYDHQLPVDFVRREVMIPMRDKTKLYTVIVMRKGTAGAPILMTRTPYDAHGSGFRNASSRIEDVLPIMDAPFVNDGYIRVYQDIRGLHRSEGQFVMTRPVVGPLNNTGIDESTDAYDTIDWLVKHVPESNGRVGVIGSSYPGFLAAAALIHPHPALKAAAPESPMVDTWKGDDDFHNGAFRAPALDYFVTMSTGKADADAGLALGNGDDYSRWLEAGSVADFVERHGIGHYPSVRKVMDNPAYTDFWKLQAVDKWLAKEPLTVPTMLIVGQWDQEDSYGAPAMYKVLEPKDVNNDMVSLVIGPWAHSAVNHYGDALGDLSFTGDTAAEFRTTVLKQFFDRNLKGASTPATPPVWTYATGVNRWEQSDKWPNGALTPLYLTGTGSAGFAQAGTAGHDDYVADPAHPVPYLPRPIEHNGGSNWRTWLVKDQRFVSDRPDVMSYSTAPLAQPVHIMGAPQADLFVTSSATDGDVVVKLIDVYPDDIPESSRKVTSGFELPIGIEIFRGRFLHDEAKATPLTPGQAERFRFGLPNVDHVFLPGHRIMVQVQSSLFPLYDRNPQTFVPNIFFAKPADYRKANVSVNWGGATPSAVWLPIAR